MTKVIDFIDKYKTYRFGKKMFNLYLENYINVTSIF